MIRALPLLLICLFAVDAFAESSGWRRAKNTADDVIYDGKDRTFYCGCVYTSNETSTGSGTVDHAACGYEGPETHSARAGRIEWEHIVPASLMPAKQMRAGRPSIAGSWVGATNASGTTLGRKACCSTCTTWRRQLGR